MDGNDTQPFLLEIGSEEVLPKPRIYFFDGKEASAVKLVRGDGNGIAYGKIDVHKLALHFALKDIAGNKLGDKRLYPYLLAHFAAQSLLHAFAPVHVPAYGGVPLSGLYVLPHGTALQVEPSLCVKQMQMDHGMQFFPAAVGLAAREPSQHISVLVHAGQKFIRIVFHNKLQTYVHSSRISSELSP